LIGGAPTYVLTDNERTVTDSHICGIAIRNQMALDVSRYYGVTIATCVPADPESKGGSESSVKLAKADLVPTEYNLLLKYRTFEEKWSIPVDEHLVGLRGDLVLVLL
jgi:hypothetical protein